VLQMISVQRPPSERVSWHQLILSPLPSVSNSRLIRLPPSPNCLDYASFGKTLLSRAVHSRSASRLCKKDTQRK